MKVIDLLNKIANGEEVPEYIQYYNMLKDKTDIMMVCKENIIYKLDQSEIQLNSRVEIIEEDKKIGKIDKLYKYKENLGEEYYENILKVYDESEYEINEAMSFVIDKINEIIDYLNNKGE